MPIPGSRRVGTVSAGRPGARKPRSSAVFWELCREATKAETRWRRGWDSNPRYGLSPYNGLANRRLQPLGHPSNRHSSITWGASPPVQPPVSPVRAIQVTLWRSDNNLPARAGHLARLGRGRQAERAFSLRPDRPIPPGAGDRQAREPPRAGLANGATGCVQPM